MRTLHIYLYILFCKILKNILFKPTRLDFLHVVFFLAFFPFFKYFISSKYLFIPKMLFRSLPLFLFYNFPIVALEALFLVSRKNSVLKKFS